jgi:hypothetical protein
MIDPRNGTNTDPVIVDILSVDIADAPAWPAASGVPAARPGRGRRAGQRAILGFELD